MDNGNCNPHEVRSDGEVNSWRNFSSTLQAKASDSEFQIVDHKLAFSNVEEANSALLSDFNVQGCSNTNPRETSPESSKQSDLSFKPQDVSGSSLENLSLSLESSIKLEDSNLIVPPSPNLGSIGKDTTSMAQKEKIKKGDGLSLPPPIQRIVVQDSSKNETKLLDSPNKQTQRVSIPEAKIGRPWIAFYWMVLGVAVSYFLFCMLYAKLEVPDLHPLDVLSTDTAVVPSMKASQPFFTMVIPENTDEKFPSATDNTWFENMTDAVFDIPQVKSSRDNLSWIADSAKSFVFYLKLLTACVMAAICCGYFYLVMGFASTGNSTHHEPRKVLIKADPADRVSFNTPIPTRVEPICDFLLECQRRFSRNGRLSRRDATDPLPSGMDLLAYESLTKDELRFVGHALSISSDMAGSDNKATLIYKVVTRYECVLKCFTVPEIREVLHIKQVSTTTRTKKKEMVKLALESGF